MFKVDIHTHILPKTWPDLREKYGYGGWIRLEHHKPCCARMLQDDHFFREIDHNCWDPQVRMKECDDCGVDVQVLSTVPVMFGYWAKPEHTHDLSKFLNDHIAQVCDAHPERFVGLGTVPMQDPKRAVQELERCVTELGLAGIEIGTHVPGPETHWNLDAPEVFAVFEAAAELGAAVFVHPWDMMGRDTMQQYWLPWLVGMPAESSRAICSMIFGGVFERLPKLRVAFAHGGGSFPHTIGRIEHGFRVRPDLCAVNNQWSPRNYLDRFYVDSLVHDPEALRYLITLFGEDHIALGSDYPFPLGEACPGGLIETMPDLTDQQKQRILGGTALEFLNLSPQQFAGAPSNEAAAPARP